MQLSLALPVLTQAINNPLMASKDRSDAETLEAVKKLRNKALRLLTTREHSREELLRKLAQARARRTSQDAVNAVEKKDEIERLLDDLAAAGWQSDERYAEAMVRRLAGQASRRYIENKLAEAGIKKDAASLALDALEQDDAEVAQALWQRRFGGETPADDKVRQKQIRFLLTRGFHLGDAFKIVPRVPVATVDGTRRSGLSGRSNWRAASANKVASTAAQAEPELFGDAEAPQEYTRTSSLRSPAGKSSSFGNRKQTGNRGRQQAEPSSTEAEGATPASSWPSGSRSGFKSSFRRARPWGARNDADPSDE